MSSQDEILRVGVIGLGVGEQHILGYQQHEFCKVVSICDFDEAKLAEVGGRYPDIRRVGDAEEILSNSNIDVVSIASYDDMHHEQIIRALDAGKHVFAEKPLCQTIEHAREIRSKLNENPNLRMSSNLVLRKSLRFMAVKKLIDDGAFGDMFSVESDYLFGRLHKIVDGWRGKIDGYSGVFGGGVHVIDLLMWLLDDEIVEVQAYGNAIASQGTGFENNDMVTSLLKFKSGIIGKMSVSLGCVYPHFHRLSLFGTDASFVNERDHGLLYTSRDKDVQPEKIIAEYPGVGKGDLIPSFIDAILEAGDPVVNEDDVFRAMSVCFAIERAHHEGGLVTVEQV